MHFDFTGSGTNWVSHLIELATGIQTQKKSMFPDQSYIATLDHFLDKLGDIGLEKTSNGVQIVIPSKNEFEIDIRLFHQHQ